MTKKKYSKNVCDAVIRSIENGDVKEAIKNLIRCCYYHDFLTFELSMLLGEAVEHNVEVKRCQFNL